jgi:phosphomannomutase
MIEMAAISGLIAVGCRVTSLGIVTTPGVGVMTEHLNADGGMVITASHNPIIWNGLKSIRYDGSAPTANEAREIIERYKTDQVRYAPVELLCAVKHDSSTHRVHVDRVLSQVDVGLIRKKKLKVVLDSVHGAGGPSAAILLNELGVELIHLYAETTGRFPHPPEPTREHLQGLGKAVKDYRADIGFAQDPDADRLAVVDERGVYIGEEYTLVLACLSLLSRSLAKTKPIVVANLSTSRMIDDVVSSVGGRVVRTPVGEANVAAAIRDYSAVIGGEGNGGVIWPSVVHVRDSISGIALILEMLARQNQSASVVIGQVPCYAICKHKMDVGLGESSRLIEKIKRHYSDKNCDLQDGLRVDWEDRWVHIRSSNTEPILRIIAEARNQELAEKIVREVIQVLTNENIHSP